MKWKVQYGNRKREKISLKREQRSKEFKERRKYAGANWREEEERI